MYCFSSLHREPDTHPFKAFRKASPAITDAERDRAASASRMAARERSRTATTTGTFSNGSSLSQNVSPGGTYLGGGRYTSPSPSIVFEPATVTPARNRLTGLMRKGGGAGGSTGTRTPVNGVEQRAASYEHPRGYGGSASGKPPPIGFGRTGSGQWAELAYTAPTAPYEGEDGVRGLSFFVQDEHAFPFWVS